MKERRVGTFTFGISLILFGVLFLIKTIFKSFNYAFIFHMWPIMLIMLGGEIIYYTLRFNDKHFKSDIVYGMFSYPICDGDGRCGIFDGQLSSIYSVVMCNII